jgi:hypothetical protein
MVSNRTSGSSKTLPAIIMKPISHKKNHFVPQVYLKQWTQNDKGNIGLYTLNLRDNLARKQAPADIAKKKNLYTLPLNYGPETKLTEKIIFKIHEDCWSNVTAALNIGNSLTREQTIQLRNFVINQSLRTPKFARETTKIIEQHGDVALKDIPFSVQWAYLGIKIFPTLAENCCVELYYSLELKNFITSDNPATHWLSDGINFTYLNGIAKNNTLFKNPLYKIVCPLTPRYFAILTPNLGIPISDAVKSNVVFRQIDGNTINLFNSLTEKGADKLLFARTLTDLI